MPDGERGFDEEAVKLMAAKKLYYNPTLQTGSARYDELRNRGESGTLTRKDKDTLEALGYKFQKKFENLRRIIDHGVEIVAGSDASGLGNSTRLIRALEMMHEAGMSRIQVIRSATSIAAKAMKMDDKIGSIKPGVEADIIGVKGDVSLDISSLRKTRFVMKSGVKIVN
jgi:imidazolonepropionase-like amidohydrolase